MKSFRYTVVGALRLLLLLAPLAAQAQLLKPLDLSPMQDPELQRALSRLVSEQGWDDRVINRSLEVALVVINERGGHRLAMLNGDNMVYAASLPKIAILFAAMVSSQNDELVIEGSLEQDMHDMIRVSCNACATRVMEAVGRERVLQILQMPQYGFYNEQLYGGLWVGKDYAGAAAHSRDPIKGLSHGATAYQVARLYYRLYRGSLLDEKHTAMMLDMLARPGISHKFVKALEGEHGIRMWRKSGSWRHFHADSVLVKSDAGTYILVGLAQGAGGEELLQQLARAVHRLIKDL